MGSAPNYGLFFLLYTPVKQALIEESMAPWIPVAAALLVMVAQTTGQAGFAGARKRSLAATLGFGDLMVRSGIVDLY